MSGPSFGALLQSARKARGLSQSALAEKLGVNATYISHLEHDRREPSVMLLRLMGRVLDVSPVVLFRPLAERPTKEDDRG